MDPGAINEIGKLNKLSITLSDAFGRNTPILF
jgi:hypothetical protein